MQSRTRHPPRDRGEETPREKGRAAAQEVLQRLKRAFRFEGATGHRKEGELSWRHRLSRPQRKPSAKVRSIWIHVFLAAFECVTVEGTAESPLGEVVHPEDVDDRRGF